MIIMSPDIFTFSLDLELSSSLDTAHLVGGDALVDAGVTADEAQDLEAGATDQLRRKCCVFTDVDDRERSNILPGSIRSG